MDPNQKADLRPEEMAAHPRLSPVVTSEMSRLFSAGFWLLPLGGSDGKKPIVDYRNRKRHPLSLVVDKLAAAGSQSYGIRLKDMIVVDVDTDTPEARQYVESRFGTSPARTRTGRGFHLYFRHTGPIPKQVRLPRIAIDFKSGENAFVVGPQSERPDGVVYWPEGRLIAPDVLPAFVDRGVSSGETEGGTVNRRYPQGVRRDTLKRRAFDLAQVADSFDEMVADLLAFRDWEVEQPEDFSDDHLVALAQWFWEKRERGELWSKSNSVVQIRRAALDHLAALGEGLAFLLYSILVSAHGHNPGAPFAIVPDALRDSGRLNAGRRQIYAAIGVLLEAGLLVYHQKSCGNRSHHLYRFGLGVWAGAGEEKKEGSRLILISEKDTHSDEELAA
jgi:hypothetical protein